MMEKQETSDVRQQPVNNSGVDLKDMYRQVREVESGVLFSGLAILVKDMAIYLTACGIDDDMAEAFRLSYLDMLNNDRDYWQQFAESKLYRPLKEARLPEGFASGAAQRDVTLSPLSDPYWGKVEWLRAPGWHFFKTYVGQRREDVLRDITLKPLSEDIVESPLDKLKRAFCECKDPYKKPSPKSSCEREEEVREANPFIPVEAVVKRLAGTDRHVTAFWYPVMLYLVLLLHKTNFEALEDTAQ